MELSPVIVLTWQALALILSFSVALLLIFWHQWRTALGRAMLEFVGSIMLLQAGTLMTHVAVFASLDDALIKGCATVAVSGFYLVALTSLALLLHAAQAMKDAWELVSRVGVTALVLGQPALWQHSLLAYPSPLEHDLFASPYTRLGTVAALVCGGFVVMTLYTGWRYWRRIDAAPLTGTVMLLAGLQGMLLLSAPAREYALTSAGGSMVCPALGYHLVRQFENRPQPSQMRWLNAVRSAGAIVMAHCDVPTCLHRIAEHTRELLHTDTVYVLKTIGPDRLEIVAAAGKTPAALGRHIRIGEGLAGRVMQSLQSMRVDDYRHWNGRAVEFDDLPLCASLSVPLIYEGKIVGAINAHETLPGRLFSDRDQVILELLAPHATLVIVQARLERELHLAQVHVETLLAQSAAAVFIFDAAGALCEANALARQYLRRVFGERDTLPTSIELAAQAQDARFTDALVGWTVEAQHEYRLITHYPGIGSVSVRLQTIVVESPAQVELVVTMQAPPEAAPAE